jgi:hypothetical protein
MLSRTNCRTIIASLAGLLVAGECLGAGVINVPLDQPTIADAILAADDGDEIVIAPGEYFERFELMGKAITLRSWFPDDPETVAATIINGGGEPNVIRCISEEGPETIIDGLTITGGLCDLTDLNGGGLLNLNSSPTVRRCRFIDNRANDSGRGGAIYNDNSSPTVEQCSFVGNKAGSGGAVYNKNGGTPTFRYCSFSGNDATDDVGGAMGSSGASVTAEYCMFTSNNAPSDGAVGNSVGTHTFIGCSFSGNTAQFGGAMSSYPGAVVTLSGCEFIGNIAGDSGSALRSVNVAPTLTDCVICGNGPDPIFGDYIDNGGNEIGDACAPPQPVGACCLVGSCAALIETDCLAAGGTYLGDGTDCDDAECAAPCPGDSNGDGSVDVADLLVVLAAWGACP